MSGGDMSTRTPPARMMWAYAYQIVPAQPEGRLSTIRAVLEAEHSLAKEDARTWQGKFVQENQITHILVVSDSPDQDGDANRRLEAALKELQTGFVLTAPMPVLGGPPTPVPAQAER